MASYCSLFNSRSVLPNFSREILSRRGIQTPFLKDAYACAVEPEEQESCDRKRFIPELLVPVPLDKGNAGAGNEIAARSDKH